MEIRVNVLSEKELQEVHEATLEVLSTIGVRVDHQKICELLYEAGATIKDKKKGIVLFGENLVKEALARAPALFKLSNRKGEYKELSPGGEITFWTPCVMAMVEDGMRKELTSKKFIEFVRIVDSLENVYGVVGASISDYPPQVRDFAGFRLMAEYTGKHIRPIAFAPEGVDAVIEMAKVLLNGASIRESPIFSLGHSGVTPLRWTHVGLERFHRSAGYGIPMSVHAGPLLGGTSPITIAGTLVLANAEVLSGLIINQVLEPGRPCYYNLGFGRILDLRTLTGLTGSVENILLSLAGSDLSRYYKLPSAGWSNTESMLVDAQAIYEKSMTYLSYILGKQNMIWGVGQLESELSVSNEQAVIDDEMISAFLKIQGGVKVTKETMALDVIKDVVLKDVGVANRFLEHEHTLIHYKEEMFFPELSNRKTREDWMKEGGKSLGKKAKEKCQEILKSDEKIYVTEKQQNELLKIEQKYTDMLTGK